jgi:hypothetical protein
MCVYSLSARGKLHPLLIRHLLWLNNSLFRHANSKLLPCVHSRSLFCISKVCNSREREIESRSLARWGVYCVLEFPTGLSHSDALIAKPESAGLSSRLPRAGKTIAFVALSAFWNFLSFGEKRRANYFNIQSQPL